MHYAPNLVCTVPVSVSISIEGLRFLESWLCLGICGSPDNEVAERLLALHVCTLPPIQYLHMAGEIRETTKPHDKGGGIMETH
jgi:hypothetical protein